MANTVSKSDTPWYRTAERLLREAIPPRKKLYAMSIICMIGVAAFTAALAWSTKLIVNDVFVAGSSANARYVAMLVVVISLGMALSRYANSVVSLKFQRSVAISYQKRVFDELLRRDVTYFAGLHATQHMSRVTLFGRSCGLAVVAMTNRFLTDMLTLIGLVAVMSVQDPLMSLAALALLPLIGGLVTLLTRRVREISAAGV